MVLHVMIGFEGGGVPTIDFYWFLVGHKTSVSNLTWSLLSCTCSICHVYTLLTCIDY